MSNSGKNRLTKEVLLFAFSGIFIGVACVKLYLRGINRGLEHSNDFAVYYCSTRAWLDGTNPYDPENLRQIAEFSGGAPELNLANAFSPPVTFVVLAPFAIM